MTANSSRKHLVLLGTGRAHLQVLKGLARQMSSDMSVTLVAPYPYYIESEMLAGHVAGRYALDEIRVPLDSLVENSAINFLPAHVLALDPVNRRVQLSTGDALPYDVLSVDVEPVVDRENIDALMPGSRENALFIHPLEAFVKLWPQLLGLASERAMQVAVIADSLGDIELSMAAAHALAMPHGSRVTLVARLSHLLAPLRPSLQRRIQNQLQGLGITVLQDSCTAIDREAVHLASGAILVCDAPLVAGGASIPAWLLQSGMEADEHGHLQINERLQSDSHRQVFVVPPDAPAEFGPVLEANLRTALGGGTFKKARAKARRPLLMSCGATHAIGTWGPLVFEGHGVWSHKERRDRRELADLFSF